MPYVDIPDPNLKAAINHQLDPARLPGQDITDAEMLSLTVLYASNYGIENLTGLGSATNLYNLQLSHNLIIDIRPLHGLTSLSLLELDANQITDISFFSSNPLPNLFYLTLDNNQFIDISPLSGLSQLATLTLAGNNLVDISPLNKLVNLFQLFLSKNQISDITPLTELINLSSLALNNNHIADITPLTGLLSLHVLYLNDNQISDITPLTGLTEVNELSLENNQITDIIPLSGFKYLMNLNLNKNKIIDISILKGEFPDLMNLLLNNNQIIDITPLNDLVLLKRLDLSYNLITDIYPLKEVSIEDFLNLDNNRISDLSPLYRLYNYSAKNQTIYFNGTWNSGTLIIPTSFLKDFGGSIPSTITNIKPSSGIYSSASKSVTWQPISYNTQASYDFKGSNYFSGTVIRLGNSGPKALQLQLSNSSAVTVNYNSPVIFNNVIYSSGGIDYDPTSGKITFSSSGLYSINWWISAITALTPSGAVFGIQIIGGKTILGNGSNKLTGVNGNALIEVITPPLQIQLINLTTRNSQNINVQLSNTVPVQADISIVDFFGTPF